MSASSSTLEVVTTVKDTPETAALAGQIKATANAARAHAQLAIVYAMRIGLLCDKAKAALPHGTYEDWLKQHGIGKMTAHRDRQLANSAMLALLPAGDISAPDFVERVEDDKKFRAGLIEKVKDVAGEATVTDLMKDLGIIRAPKNEDPETGKRVHYPAKEKKLSPEQVAKQNRAAARQRILAALGELKAALDDKQVKRWMEAKDWTDVRKIAGDRMKVLNAIADKAEAAAAKSTKGGK